MSKARILLFTILIFASSLACRAATRLVVPDTPTPLPPTPTATLPPPTPTPLAVCIDETASIIKAADEASYPSGNFPNVDTGDNVDLPLVTFKVTGDTIGDPHLETVPKNLRKYQSDLQTQQKAWDLFVALVPADQRRMLAEYQVVTDGAGEILALVEQTRDDPNAWILEIDIADMPDTKNLVFTLLHEFGHLLTLNTSQVPPDMEIFLHPESNSIYNHAASLCPNYFPGEGCSLPDSYVNSFFDRFWSGLYDEWHKIDNISNDTKRQQRLDVFYQKYKDRFVDDYAVTDPSEDIAETWVYFVLRPTPQGGTIADQKLLFFYQYPELVKIRERILQNLCTVHP